MPVAVSPNHVWQCEVGDEGMMAVALHCPHLHTLTLLSCQVADAGLAAFHRCGRRFKSLTLHNCSQASLGNACFLA